MGRLASVSPLRSLQPQPAALLLAILLGSLGACSSGDSASEIPPGSTAPATASFTSRDPAVIVNALTVGGVQICKELLLPIPNKSYRFEDTRELTLTVPRGACHTSVREMEAEPSHGFLSLERFTAASDRDAGLAVHKEELVTGTALGDYNPAKVMWSYGEYLVVLSHGTTPDVEALVWQAMSTVPDAVHIYSSPAATPR